MEFLSGVKILLLVLMSCVNTVELQDGIESSGAGDVTEIVLPDLFETSASGGGPDTTSDAGINVGILSDIAEQELNGTYIPFVMNNGNPNAVNDTLVMDLADTTTKKGETTVPSTTQEATTKSTTTRETTILTDAPVTTTTIASLETSPSETTTTEAQTTTTTVVVKTTKPKTTQRTTKRPLPPKPTKPVLSTTISTTTSDDELTSCIFTEEDFECSVEITCFGDGELDCTETDEQQPHVTTSTAASSIEYDYDEDDDDVDSTSLLSTEPSQLTGRVPPWKRLSSMRRHRFSLPTTTEVNTERQTIPTTATSTAPTTIQEAPTTGSTMKPTETTSAINVPTTTTEKDEMETTSIKSIFSELPTVLSFDNSSEAMSSEIEASSSERNQGKEIFTSAAESTSRVSVGAHTEDKTDSPNGGESLEMVTSKTRMRRSKRQNNHPASDYSVLSPSESLKLSSFSVSKERQDARFCRINGNLKCSPLPTLGMCKGKGRCQAPVEKQEKSTGEKGVENWAIAVIAICATAAAVTIGLLVYLVITSWKKLKVQPQNGVTTLTYVNNATP